MREVFMRRVFETASLLCALLFVSSLARVALGAEALGADDRGGTARSSDRPRVAHELELEVRSLRVGDSVAVIGRFQSRLGREVLLEDSTVHYRLPVEERRFEALRDERLRTENLELRGRVIQATAEQVVVELEAIEFGPASTELFEAMRADSDLSLARGRAISRWVLSESERDVELSESARVHAIELIDAHHRAGESEVANLLTLLEATHRYFVDDPRWSERVSRLANTRGDRVDVRSTAEKLGFVKDASGWLPEARVLERLGMVRKGDRLMTREQALLDEAIETWERERRSKALLRGMTAEQYDESAGRREIQEGMNRLEALKCWGYPARVTWRLRRGERFEAWCFPDRTAFFLDGAIFDWRE